MKSKSRSASAASPTPPALPASSDWFTEIGGALEEMVWVWEAASGKVIYANPAFTRFWGRSAAELGHGRDVLLDNLLPEDLERMERARSQVEAQPYTEEYRVLRPGVAAGGPDERTMRLRERAFTVPRPGGELHVIHVARDVSWQFDTTAQLRAEINRRTDAERNLSDATLRFEALVASANDAIITIDAHSKIIDWNRAAERTFGWLRNEALGRSMAELIIPPEFRRQHAAGIARFLRDGTAQIFGRRVEAVAQRRNGEQFDAELSVWPVRTGSSYTFSSFVRDISRRKTAERALAESEAKYRQVVENVNEGILVAAGGRIVYANPRMLNILELDLPSASALPFTEFIHPEDRQRVTDNHVRRMRGEPVENYYQFRLLRPSGLPCWVEISGVMFEWQGQPATLNFLSDVTQRRQTEQDMITALARERELSELKSRFVAVASHEFRTPLAAILTSVELLDDYGARLPEDERKEILGQIKTAVARMNGMVEQVLITSKLESGHFSFAPEPHDISDLLVQLAAEMDQAHPQAARVSMRCDGLDGPRLVDAQLVRHVLTNLLNNALKYSPLDSPVTCAASAQGDTLCFAVADRGIGIPQADLPRLFERFHRGTNVGNIQGTGIGLHIVKECVDLHHGTIAVESEAGQGTIFHVRLHAPSPAVAA